jgi:hypothetical protein
MIGMYTFRAFAADKPSWMLSYSWMKGNKIKPMEPMKNLALSNLMAGTNNYDARGQVMSGSNDIETRKLIYKWVAENETTFYKPRHPIAPIGIYFSPKTRNYYADSFIESFQGMMKMMLQGHMEFQIVTPKTLKEFSGDVLILPDVKCISAEETALVQKYFNSGKGLVVTGETGRYDDHGQENKKNMVFDFLKISEPGKQLAPNKEKNKFIYYPDCPGKLYSKYTEQEFDKAAWSGSFQKTDFFSFLNNFKNEVLGNFGITANITIEASPFISTQVALVEGKPHVFMANFSGLKNDETVNQIPEKGIKIKFTGAAGAKVFYLPFLGEKQQLNVQFDHGQVICDLPTVEKGGVVWLEK